MRRCATTHLFSFPPSILQISGAAFPAMIGEPQIRRVIARWRTEGKRTKGEEVGVWPTLRKQQIITDIGNRDDLTFSAHFFGVTTGDLLILN
jgi:hypothetical protein